MVYKTLDDPSPLLIDMLPLIYSSKVAMASVQYFSLARMCLLPLPPPPTRKAPFRPLVFSPSERPS